MSYYETDRSRVEKSAEYYRAWKIIGNSPSSMEPGLFKKAGIPGYTDLIRVPDISGVWIRKNNLLVPNIRNGRHVIFLTAPSNTGKDALEKYILRICPDLISPVVTATDRPKRKDEIDGIDQIFVKPQKFLDLINANELLEYHTVRPPYSFGIPYESIYKAQESGSPILVFKINLDGIHDVKPIIEDFIAPATTIGIIPKQTLSTYRTNLFHSTKEGADARYQTAKWELWSMGTVCDIILENPWEPNGVPTIAGESFHQILHVLSDTKHQY